MTQSTLRLDFTRDWNVTILESHEWLYMYHGQLITCSPNECRLAAFDKESKVWRSKWFSGMVHGMERDGKAEVWSMLIEERSLSISRKGSRRLVVFHSSSSVSQWPRGRENFHHNHRHLFKPETSFRRHYANLDSPDWDFLYAKTKLRSPGSRCLFVLVCLATALKFFTSFAVHKSMAAAWKVQRCIEKRSGRKWMKTCGRFRFLD